MNVLDIGTVVFIYLIIMLNPVKMYNIKII